MRLLPHLFWKSKTRASRLDHKADFELPGSEQTPKKTKRLTLRSAVSLAAVFVVLAAGSYFGYRYYKIWDANLPVKCKKDSCEIRKNYTITSDDKKLENKDVTIKGNDIDEVIVDGDHRFENLLIDGDIKVKPLYTELKLSGKTLELRNGAKILATQNDSMEKTDEEVDPVSFLSKAFASSYSVPNRTERLDNLYVEDPVNYDDTARYKIYSLGMGGDGKGGAAGQNGLKGNDQGAPEMVQNTFNLGNAGAEARGGSSSYSRAWGNDSDCKSRSPWDDGSDGDSNNATLAGGLAGANVSLIYDSIIFGAGSFINVDGNNGTGAHHHDGCGSNASRDTVAASGGGGGGSIYLQTSDLQMPSDRAVSPSPVAGGYGMVIPSGRVSGYGGSTAESGVVSITDNFYVQNEVAKYMSAKGGQGGSISVTSGDPTWLNGSYQAGGGAGGRITIKLKPSVISFTGPVNNNIGVSQTAAFQYEVKQSTLCYVLDQNNVQRGANITGMISGYKQDQISVTMPSTVPTSGYLDLRLVCTNTGGTGNAESGNVRINISTNPTVVLRLPYYTRVYDAPKTTSYFATVTSYGGLTTNLKKVGFYRYDESGCNGTPSAEWSLDALSIATFDGTTTGHTDGNQYSFKAYATNQADLFGYTGCTNYQYLKPPTVSLSDQGTTKYDDKLILVGSASDSGVVSPNTAWGFRVYDTQTACDNDDDDYLFTGGTYYAAIGNDTSFNATANGLVSAKNYYVRALATNTSEVVGGSPTCKNYTTTATVTITPPGGAGSIRGTDFACGTGNNYPGSTCSKQFEPGAGLFHLYFDLNTSNDYNFGYWNAPCEGASADKKQHYCSITPNSPKSVTGYFWKASLSAPATGTVGVPLTLTASADMLPSGGGAGVNRNYKFYKDASDYPTSPACSSTNATCSVTYTTAGSHAAFMVIYDDSYYTGQDSASATINIAASTHKLSVTKTSGSGSVSSSPAGITNCNFSGTCEAQFNDNSDVTVTATPATGYNFSSWTGCDSQTTDTPPKCVKNIGTSDKTVSVAFSPQTFSITPSAGGSGSGTITPNTVQTINYNGSSQPFTASATWGSFDSFCVKTSINGSCTYYSSPYTFSNVLQNYWIVANFSAPSGDTTPPAAPTINPVTSPVNAASQVVRGTAEANALVKITGGVSLVSQQLSGGATSYLISVPLTQNATNSLRVTATDAAGNVSPAATATIVEDSIAPTVTITGTTPTKLNPSVTITFSESVTGLDLSDYVNNPTWIGNGSATNLTGTGMTYTLTILPTAQGNVTIDLPADVAQDAAGNGNNAAARFTVVYDSVAPTLTEITPVPTPASDTTPDYTFRSNEAGPITYGGDCLASSYPNATASDNRITFDVLAVGTYSNCTIRVTDSAGNISNSLAVTSFTIQGVDITVPTFQIQYYSDAALTPANSLGNNPRLKSGIYFIKITANEALSASPRISIDAEGTGSDDVVNAGTIRIDGTDDKIYYYQRIVWGVFGQVGTTLEDISITGTDLAGNTATNVNPTDEATKAAYIDVVAPTITSITAASPTKANPIPVSITFSESIGSSFTMFDPEVTNGTASSLTDNGGNNYTFSVAAFSTPVTVKVPAGAVADLAGNVNTAESSLLSIDYDLASPIVTSFSPSSGTVNTQMTFNVAFNEDMSTSPTKPKITISGVNPTRSDQEMTQGVDARHFYYNYTPTSISFAATATLSGTDIAGNALIDIPHLFTVSALDTTKPTILSITGTSPTFANPMVLTITFSEQVTGLAVADFASSITNGSAQSVSGSGTTYTLNVTPSGQGTVTVSVPADAVTDGAGNGNTASSNYNFLYDSVQPTIQNITFTNPLTIGSSQVINVIFSERMAATPKISISGVDPIVSNQNMIQGVDDLHYSYSYTPSTLGAATIVLSGSDLASNPLGVNSNNFLVRAAPIGCVWSGLGGDNNWNTPANWVENAVPSDTCDIIFDSTGVKNSTIDLGFPGTIKSLSVKSGYTGTITLARDIAIVNDFTVSSGVVAFGNQNMILSGNFIKNGGNITFSNGLVSFSAASGSRTITSGGITFGSVSFVSGTWTLQDAFTVGKNLSQSGGTLQAGGNSITLNQNYTQSGGIFNAPSGTMTILGHFSKSGGTFTHNNGLVVLRPGFWVGGTFSVTNGSDPNFYDLVIDLANRGLVLNNANCNYTVNHNLTFRNTNTTDSTIRSYKPIDSSASSTVTILGDLIIDKTSPSHIGRLYVGNSVYNVNPSINLAGNLVLDNNNANVYANLTFNGSGNQTITRNAGVFEGGGTGASSYGSWKINKPSGEISTSTNITKNGYVDVIAGTMNIMGNNFSVGGAFTIRNGNKLKLYGTQTSVTAPILESNTTVVYNAPSGAPTIRNWSYYNMTIDPDVELGDNGQLGSWKMDEKSGTSLTDSTTNGKTGTSTAGAVPAIGAGGKGRSLPGDPNVIDLGSNYNITSAGSMSIWVKFNQLPSEAGRIMHLMGEGDARADFDLITMTDNKIRFYTADGILVESLATVVKDRWYHIVGTFDSVSPQRSRLYIDGVKQGESLITGSRTDSSLNLTVGKSPREWLGSYRWLNGVVDEAKILNRLLTDAEVANLYNNYSFSSANYALAADTTVANNFTVDSGKLSGNSYKLTTGNYIQNGGKVLAPATIEVYGGWDHHGGIFDPNGGNVNILGNTGTTLIQGDTDFNNFTANGGGKTIIFEAGSVHNFAGNFAANGSSGNLVGLRSSIDGNQWKINPQARAVSYVDVKDSHNLNGELWIRPTDSTDSGNNINWFGMTISGTVYTSPDKSTNIGNGATIGISIDGNTKMTTVTKSDGSFVKYLDQPTFGAHPIVIFIDDHATYKANLFSLTDDTNQDITGLELFTNTVVLSSQNVLPINNSILDTANNCNDADLLYADNGKFSANNHVLIASAKQYQPGGDVLIGGDFFNQGTFIPENYTISVAGSWKNEGTFYKGTSTVVLNSQNSATIASNSQEFYNLKMMAALGEPGLQGYWKLEDTGSDLLDSSGKARNCTAHGTAVTAGQFGNARSFNGTSDYLDCGRSYSIATAGTISMWVKFAKLPSDSGHYVALATKGDSGADFDLLANPADNRFNFYLGAGNPIASSTVIQVGVPYHVVATFGPSTPMQLYINGNLEASGVTTSRVNTEALFTIGWSEKFTSPPRFFEGMVDEVRLYDQAIAQAEVTSLYNLNIYRAVNYSLTSHLDVSNDLEVNQGTVLTAGEKNINVKNISLNGGKMIAPVCAGGCFNVSGIWRNQGGTFDNNAGTVNFIGDNNIFGDNNFYNFTADTPGKTVTFEANKTQTIQGKLTLSGADGSRINLVSSQPGTKWHINPLNTNWSVDQVSVTDSTNDNATSINPTNSVEGVADSTVRWFSNLPPKITKFTATPSRIAYNGSTTIEWATKDAESCSADWMIGNAVSGTQTLTEQRRTKTLELVCRNAAEVTVTSAIVLTVDLPAISVSMTTPQEVENGQTLATVTVTSNAIGNIQYWFWWDCDELSDSVETTNAACGSYTDSNFGMDISTADVSYSPVHKYATIGEKTLKVIVKRDNSLTVWANVVVNLVAPSKDYSLVNDSESAEPGKLPTLLMGDTTLTLGTGAASTKWHGGMQGNYVVYNYGPPYEFGFRSRISDCQDDNGGIKLGLCFILNTVNSSGVRMMRSQTTATIGGKTQTIFELPALFYGKGTILGDTFGVDISKLGSFDYWGKNLAISGKDIQGSKGSTWQLPNYQLNQNSQSAWDGKDGAVTQNKEFAKYDSRIADLMKSGTLIDGSAVESCNTWYLQSKDLCNNAVDQTAKYPDGKVWVIRNLSDDTLNINSTVRYQGKGTIIVIGNMSIAQREDLVPNIESDKLGVILQDNNSIDKGNLILNSSSTIQAMVLSKNKIIASGSNLNFIGSFVAKDFSLNESANSNLRFFYDYDLDRSMPPGFRYLEMPKPKESGNKP